MDRQLKDILHSSELINLSRSETKIETKSDKAVIIPSYSAWFTFSGIHEIEVKNFPELSDPSNADAIETYMECRNFMVNAFRENRKEYLTLTACRRALTGGVGTLIKIHSFLEQWGLINYQLEFQPLTTTGDHCVFIQGPKSVRPPDTEINLNVYPEVVDKTRNTVHCTTCGVLCTEEYYHCMKQPFTNVCKACFLEGQFSSQFYSGDFVKLQIKDEELGSEWTDQEKLYLLEGIEMHHDDWDAVAKHVGTRTREECISQFITFPIYDKYLDDIGGNSIPFLNSDNPVLSLTSFLASLVHPNIASAAAKAAIKEYEELCKSMSYDSETPFKEELQDSELIERVSRKLLDSARIRSEELIREEDSRLKSYMALIIETHIAKVENKMKQFNELEQYLVNERQDLERQKINLAKERSRLTELIKESYNKMGPKNVVGGSTVLEDFPNHDGNYVQLQ